MVTASRAFVCVRPATYESATEGKLLLSLFRGRIGNLENSVFALLGPDGKERLTKTGRSPGMLFKTAAQMAERLTELGIPHFAVQPDGRPSAHNNCRPIRPCASP